MTLTKEETIKLLDLFVNYCNERIKIYSSKKKKNRLPNFPEDVSENIVKFIINDKLKISSTKSMLGCDLVYKNEKYEIKCFSSSGPSSFVPKERWDKLFFLDATNFVDKKFKLYQINLSSDDEIWKNIKVNKFQTYEEQCTQGRRPHICFNLIKKQLSKDYIKCIFNGIFN